jgi:protein phosphatase
MEATADAFTLLHTIAGMRLRRGRLTVVDATNVQREWRRPLLELAHAHGRPAVAIVLDLPEEVCLERNRARRDRRFGAQVVRQHREQLRRSLPGLDREGFRQVVVLHTPDEVDGLTVERR